jgi:hypothetical protein
MGEISMTKGAQKVKRRHTRQKFPKGWEKVLDHDENQTEDEAVAEDEAAFAAKGQTVMIVPSALVPTIRKLIAAHPSRRSA